MEKKPKIPAKNFTCRQKLYKMASDFENNEKLTVQEIFRCLNKNWIKSGVAFTNTMANMYKAQSDQIMLKIGKIDSHLLRRCRSEMHCRI